MNDRNARLFVFGKCWGPEPDIPDKIFGFSPGRGIHDIHMNQGNHDEHWHENEVWTDGGLLFHEPDGDRWSAIFLAFQSQTWHTNERGKPISDLAPDKDGSGARGQSGQPRALIVGAYVRPQKEKDGVEHVAIRNDGDDFLDVNGWRIVNRAGDALILEGVVPPRQIRRVFLSPDVHMSPQGGLIRLLDHTGEEIDGVVYTRREAHLRHGSLTF